MISDDILAMFHQRGDGAYFGEQISTTQHMLQAAHFAQSDAAPAELVVAALLHDLGHLIQNAPEDIAEWTTDARHEEVGSRWLAARFPSAVTEPVRLHVPAKRYLCATDPGYFAMLSPASVTTLKLQGGPMSPIEVTTFENEPFHRDAVQVRRWDDRGKVPGLRTHELDAYRTLIESVATPRAPG